MAFGLQLRSSAVVDDLVGAYDVIAVVNHHIAGQRPHVAGPFLALLGIDDGEISGCRRGLGGGHGHQFLTGIVGQRI